jgi:hypothetical protein
MKTTSFSNTILFLSAAHSAAAIGSPLALFSSAQNKQNQCSKQSILDTIGDIFGDVGPGAPVYSGDPVFLQQYCLGFNYDMGDETDMVHRMVQDLFPSCIENTEDNNTCKGIQALLDSFLALKDMGCAPEFRNYLPAWRNWHQNSTTCTSGSFDPETKEFSDPNGCNVFALCDILTTILTLSADQARTGTCGTTAMLTVLSRAEPVRALQLATELLWSGTTRFLETPPCSYIYDMFPGVQPLPDPKATLEEACGKTPSADCKTFYGGFAGSSPNSPPQFIQNPGIGFMFTQAFATSYFQHVTGKCTPEGNQLIKPDFSNSKEVESYQLTTDAALVYYCRGMTDDIDYSCEIRTPTDAVNPWPSLDRTSAEYWFSAPYIVDTSKGQIEGAFGLEIPFDQVTDVNAQRYIEGLFCSIDPTGKMTPNDVINQATKFSASHSSVSITAKDSPSTPRMTESMLNEACEEANVSEHGVVVFVNSGPLNDGPNASVPQPCITGNEPNCDGVATNNYPPCNHYAVLLSCDIPNGKYRFWTWAEEIELPKEVVLADETTGLGGSMCSIMTASPANDGYVPPKPTPCDPGVCQVFCDIDNDASSTNHAKKNLRGNVIRLETN